MSGSVITSFNPSQPKEEDSTVALGIPLLSAMRQRPIPTMVSAILKDGIIYKKPSSACAQFTALCCGKPVLYDMAEDVGPKLPRRIYIALDGSTGLRWVLKEMVSSSSELFLLQKLHRLEEKMLFIEQVLPVIENVRPFPIFHHKSYAVMPYIGKDLFMHLHKDNIQSFFKRFLLNKTGNTYNSRPPKPINESNLPLIGTRAALEIAEAMIRLFGECNRAIIGTYGTSTKPSSYSEGPIKTHRDPKPENVCFSNEENTYPKATWVDLQNILEDPTGKVFGTFGYLAPELIPFRFREKKKDALEFLPDHEDKTISDYAPPSVATDIYAYGATLYYLLRHLINLQYIGKLNPQEIPKNYHSIETIGDNLTVQGWDPMLSRRFAILLEQVGFPREMGLLIYRCLAINPEERPNSWEQIVAMLKEIEIQIEALSSTRAIPILRPSAAAAMPPSFVSDPSSDSSSSVEIQTSPPRQPLDHSAFSLVISPSSARRASSGLMPSCQPLGTTVCEPALN